MNILHLKTSALGVVLQYLHYWITWFRLKVQTCNLKIVTVEHFFNRWFGCNCSPNFWFMYQFMWSFAVGLRIKMFLFSFTYFCVAVGIMSMRVFLHANKNEPQGILYYVPQTATALGIIHRSMSQYETDFLRFLHRFGF